MLKQSDKGRAISAGRDSLNQPPPFHSCCRPLAVRRHYFPRGYHQTFSGFADIPLFCRNAARNIEEGCTHPIAAVLINGGTGPLNCNTSIE